ncbi:uncharacterized protein LOC112978143 [Apteryx rowi]|uniref:uncharacterized protein LOC112978143 n=1 Tax=Apteryx rowi TaxID=308060 RepID=UPI000E1E238D|nr:uncharacterized protein LOC112978143 [Apteryx rowi]
MSSRWRCRSFGSILLFLGENLALIAEIPQDFVNGTVGQSVLLPVSYKFMNSSRFPLPFEWTFHNRSEPIASCTVMNCSLSAEGAPKHCSANHFTRAAYQGRVVLFAENASLLLQDLQLSDSGVYNITFKQQLQTRQITLTVYNPHFSLKNPDRNDPKKDISSQISAYVIGVSSCLMSFLLLLLVFCCVRHLGAVQQKKTRIIRQQEVSNAESSPMESTMMRDGATIYARVGDSFEQPQPRTTPEVVYMSVTFSDPSGPDCPLSSCAATVDLPQEGVLNFAKYSPVSK